MPLGSIVSAVGGLIGGHYDREFSRAQSAADRAFQREVYQNQIQWKAADAKKAGLHPLAALGGGAYSASPSSVPSSSSMADSLGKLGEGIGDAFTAYMNKDEIAAEKAKADQKFNKEMDLLDAQIQQIRATTQESITRGMQHTVPHATGRELIPGQVTKPKRVPVSAMSGHPAYVIQSLGKGRYDINYHPEYQQTLGDELGQLKNAVDKGTREFADWQDPETGLWYRYKRSGSAGQGTGGYWYSIPHYGWQDKSFNSGLVAGGRLNLS